KPRARDPGLLVRPGAPQGSQADSLIDARPAAPIGGRFAVGIPRGPVLFRSRARRDAPPNAAGNPQLCRETPHPGQIADAIHTPPARPAPRRRFDTVFLTGARR